MAIWQELVDTCGFGGSYRGRRTLTINGGAIIDHKAPRERRFVAVEK
jgi:hypothetical protein